MAAEKPKARPDAKSVRHRPCPICGKPATVADAPFCSTRCADVDLHRWLGGHYAVPAVDEEDPMAAPRDPDDS